MLCGLQNDLCIYYPWTEQYLERFAAAVVGGGKISYSILLTALLYLMRFRHSVTTEGGLGHAASRGEFAGGGDRRAEGLGVQGKKRMVPILFVVSLLLAVKFHHDQSASNKVWSECTKITLGELNGGETTFLNVIDHRLHIDSIAFDQWMKFLFRPENLLHYRERMAHRASPVPSISSLPMGCASEDDELDGEEASLLGHCSDRTLLSPDLCYDGRNSFSDLGLFV